MTEQYKREMFEISSLMGKNRKLEARVKELEEEQYKHEARRLEAGIKELEKEQFYPLPLKIEEEKTVTKGPYFKAWVELRSACIIILNQVKDGAEKTFDMGLLTLITDHFGKRATAEIKENGG